MGARAQLASPANRVAMIRTLLTIAGTDPTSGAGVTADLAVFRDFGFHGLWVPTALLDQDTATVHGLTVRPAEAVAREARRMIEAGRPAAIKIGVLGSRDVAEALAEALGPVAAEVPVVLDPVLASGLGEALGDEALSAAIRDGLLPIAAVTTPNVPEAERLTAWSIGDLAGARLAAERLLELGARAVLLKGGHLPGAPGDVWAAPGEERVLANLEPFPADVHGTGCHLSSALAAMLALGVPRARAAQAARRYLQGCMGALERLEGEGAGRAIIAHGEITRQAARSAQVETA